MLPSKSDVGAWICNPTVGLLVKLACPKLSRGGLVVDLSADVIPPGAAAALRFGLIERSERIVLKQVLSRDYPVIELGSGAGSVTLAIAEHLRPECAICIVEGNPVLTEWWNRNLMASPRGNIKFLPAAVACSPGGSVAFLAEPSLLGSKVSVDHVGISCMVPALSIHGIYERTGFDGFSLVCDIEGAEFSILENDSVDWLSDCQSIVMEVHPSLGRDARDLVRLFGSRGLKHVMTRHSVFGFARAGRACA